MDTPEIEMQDLFGWFIERGQKGEKKFPFVMDPKTGGPMEINPLGEFRDIGEIHSSFWMPAPVGSQAVFAKITDFEGKSESRLIGYSMQGMRLIDVDILAQEALGNWRKENREKRAQGA